MPHSKYLIKKHKSRKLFNPSQFQSPIRPSCQIHLILFRSTRLMPAMQPPHHPETLASSLYIKYRPTSRNRGATTTIHRRNRGRVKPENVNTILSSYLMSATMDTAPSSSMHNRIERGTDNHPHQTIPARRNGKSTNVYSNCDGKKNTPAFNYRS